MTADRSARWRSLLALPPIVLGVLVLLWMSAGRQPPAQAQRGEPERTVRVIEAPLLELIPKAEGYGPVQPARVWTAVAQVAGRVVEIHAKLRDGEILPEGTLLVRIDPVDYALALGQARAELAELAVQEGNAQTSLAIEERNLELAGQEVERRRKLMQQGTTSRSSVDEAERVMLGSRMAVQTLHNTLALIPTRRSVLEATVNRAGRDLERTEMRAPFTLRVANLAIEADQYVGVGQSLFEGDDVARVEVEAQFALSTLRRLFIGRANVKLDDAIVIAENIAARRANGDSPATASIEGVKQVLPGIMSSFATTLMVFGSLAFITGDIGQILRVMPIVLILVISVSLLEAFWILPHHLGHSLARVREKSPSRFRHGFERRFDVLRERGFGPLLDRAVDYRYLTLGIVIMLVILAVAMPAGGKLKFVAFPDLDGDVVEARVLLPQGTPLARTEQVVARLEAALAKVNEEFKPRQPEGLNLVRNVTVIYGQNPDAFETGPHVVRVVADLLGAELRDAPLDAFRNAWRDQVGDLADVIAIKYTEPAVGPGGRPIDLRLLGPDLESLKAASQELQTWLNGYAGVQDLSDDLRPGKREFRMRLKPSAGVLGLDAMTVADQVRGAFQGIKVDEFPVGSETYEVNLRVAAADRIGPEDLDTFTIMGRNGALVPLSVVAGIEEVRGWARIHRVDGQRAVTIQGDVNRSVANAQELLALARAEFIPGLLERYPGVRFQVQGESDESAKTGLSIVRNVLLGLIGVYMLLALQFRGYLAPITVMLVIPTALIGVVFGHMALGLNLTMPSIVGMASLFGVVVNDSILLVVFIRQARARGLPIPAAAKQAGRARFRPILLTSITTVAGLTPLLLEKSLQAQILIPLAASLAFGLATATVAALFLVPAVYAILDDFGWLGALDDEQDEAQEPVAA